MTKTSYAKLLEPGYIGKVKLRNRILKTSHEAGSFRDDEITMNEITMGYYEALAKGGAGAVSVEAPIIDYPLGSRWHEHYRIDEDRFIPGLKELTDVMHKHGAACFIQLRHEGPWQNPFMPTMNTLYEGPPHAASAVSFKYQYDVHNDVPVPLTIPEIEDITQKFINAAERAKKAGFDGVDVNAGSSHLLHNFLSPFWNKRDDEYGGTQKKRAKLLTDVISGIKKRCGDDFPIVLVMNGFETAYTIGVPDSDCFTHEMALETMKLAVEAGADAIMIRSLWLGLHVPGWLPDYVFFPEAQVPVEKMSPHYYAKESGRAAMRTMAAEAKKLLDVPIILVGYIPPELAGQMIEAGNADFIGMTRPLICDPELPNKLKEGRPEDIAPCTRCGTCLNSLDLEHMGHCRLNAAYGFGSYELPKLETKKKVVVVGGGPAGMEAARVAALRGHDVTLVEKSKQLGGLLPLASLIKGNELEDIPALVQYLERQVTMNGVKVQLGKEATAESIAAMNPDAVILATGGLLTSPELAGSGKAMRKVLTTPELHKRVKPILKRMGPKLLGWATKLHLPVGKNVVVVGAGLHGMEVAEFLVKRGRKVTLVEPTEVIGEGMLLFRFGLTMEWFKHKNVQIIAGAQNLVVTDKGVAFQDKDGVKHELEADTILPTAPLRPNRELFDALEGKIPELYLIGDGREAGMIVDAVRTGYNTAKAL